MSPLLPQQGVARGLHVTLTTHGSSGCEHGVSAPPHWHRQLQSSLDVPAQSKYSVAPPGGTTVAQKVQSQGFGVPATWPLARPMEVMAGAAQTRPPAAMPRVMSVRLLRLDVRPPVPAISTGLPASFGLGRCEPMSVRAFCREPSN
jgi:hypothetical protein